MRIALKLAGAAAVASMICGSAASADPIADFYKNKNINWILSAGAGGGYSSYAHAFAPFFSKHIPGNPKIVVQNMPGAGGIKASNYLMDTAPKDGTTIGLIHSSVVLAPLYGLEGATFDPRKFNWLGSLNTASGICVAWHTSGIKTWEDLKAKKFVVGTSGAGSQMETLPTMLNNLFDANIKIVSGYKGGNDVFLAMERGEVHGRCGGLVASINSTRPDWFPQHKVNVPIQFSMKRSAKFPDTMSIGELAKDQRTKQILQLIFTPQALDRPVLLPPGTPADKVAALRKAFKEAMEDPEFIAAAEKQHLAIDYVSGEEVANEIQEAYSVPKEIAAAAKDAMNTEGDDKEKK